MIDKIRKWLGMEPRRYVMLRKYDGDLVRARAYHDGNLWRARYISLDDCWSILLPNGRTIGTSLVNSWYPAQGWPPEEVELWMKKGGE